MEATDVARIHLKSVMKQPEREVMKYLLSNMEAGVLVLLMRRTPIKNMEAVITVILKERVAALPIRYTGSYLLVSSDYIVKNNKELLVIKVDT